VSWTLQHAATTQSLSAWGLSGCTLTEQNLSAGMLTAKFDGDQLADVPFAYLDKITLRDGDTIRFVGHALPPVRSHDEGGEYIQLSFACPWIYFTLGSLTQQAYDAVGEAAYASARVALFADITAGTSWTSIDLATQLARIVTACNTNFGGSIMQLGTLTGSFAITPPPVQFEGGTFEDALRLTLGLIYDAAHRWDYTTTPPTLQFIRRGSATPVERAHTLSNGSEFSRLDDQVLRGVRLVWLYKALDGSPAASVDAAGESTGLGIVEAVFTIDDQSEPPTTIPAIVDEQLVRSVATTDATDITGTRPNPAEEWYFKYLGFDKIVADVADMVVIHPANAASVTGLSAGPFVGDAPTLELDAEAEENDGKTGFGGCTRYLLEGDIPKWMQRDDHIRIGLLKAEVLTRELPPRSTRYRFQIHTINRRLRMTDLGSNGGTSYTNTTQAAQTIGGGAGIIIPPSGLAAILLAARNTAHWAGQWVVTAAECDWSLQLGGTLNVTGALTAWATMAAQIQSVSHDLDNGRTTAQVGPPEHLSVQDFVRMLGSLKVQPANWINQQAGGEEA
jgi:hypothetical protein